MAYNAQNYAVFPLSSIQNWSVSVTYLL